MLRSAGSEYVEDLTVVDEWLEVFFIHPRNLVPRYRVNSQPLDHGGPGSLGFSVLLMGTSMHRHVIVRHPRLLLLLLTARIAVWRILLVIELMWLLRLPLVFQRRPQAHFVVAILVVGRHSAVFLLLLTRITFQWIRGSRSWVASRVLLRN